MTGNVRDAFCCLSFHVSGEELLPPFSPAPSLSHHFQISLSPLPPFLSLNPARLAVLAFRRSPSRIPPPIHRRCSCLPASAVPEAAAGSSTAGVEPAASGGWVCRMVVASWSIRTPDPPQRRRLLWVVRAMQEGLGRRRWGGPGLWFSSCVGLVRRCFEEQGTGAAMRGGGHWSTAARRGGGCRGGSGGSSGSSSSLGSCYSSCTTTRRSSSGRPSWWVPQTWLRVAFELLNSARSCGRSLLYCYCWRIVENFMLFKCFMFLPRASAWWILISTSIWDLLNVCIECSCVHVVDF